MFFLEKETFLKWNYQMNEMCTLFGWIKITTFVAGIIEIIRYFVTKIDERYKRNDFILGVVLLAVAIIILLCKYTLSDIVAVSFGVAIIVSGALKIQDTLDAKKIGKSHIKTYMILVFICIALGALVIINYFYILDYRLLYISAGIGMLFSGITDMVSNLYLAYAKTKYEKNKAVEEKKDDIVEDSNEE